MSRLRTLGELLEEDRRARPLVKTLGEVVGMSPERIVFNALTTPKDCDPHNTDTMNELLAKQRFAEARVRELQSKKHQGLSQAAIAAIDVDLIPWKKVSGRLDFAISDLESKHTTMHDSVKKSASANLSTDLTELKVLYRYQDAINKGRVRVDQRTRDILVKNISWREIRVAEARR